MSTGCVVVETRSLLAQRLAEARKRARLTQRQVAAKLGVTHGAVGNWETGTTEPDAQMLARLARLYRVSSDYLLGLDNGAEVHPEAPVTAEEEPVPAAAMPEPTTPDWDAPPAPGPAPTLQELVRRIDDQERRIRELERKLGKDT